MTAPKKTAVKATTVRKSDVSTLKSATSTVGRKMFLIDLPMYLRSISAENDWGYDEFLAATGHELLAIQYCKKTKETNRVKRVKIDFHGLTMCTPDACTKTVMDFNIFRGSADKFHKLFHKFMEIMPELFHKGNDVEVAYIESMYNKQLFTWRRIPIMMSSVANGKEQHDRKLLLTKIDGEDVSSLFENTSKAAIIAIVGKFVNKTLCNIETLPERYRTICRGYDVI